MTHDLASTLMEKMEQLDSAIKTLNLLGEKKAEAEKTYRCEYAKCILSLRADSLPVSLIEGVAKGTEEIAKAKLEWDIAESKYETRIQAIQAIKKEIDIYNDIIRREWGSPN